MIPEARCKATLLRYMYRDHMTVARQVSVVDKEGADAYEMQNVYVNIPCHLGLQGGRLTGERTDSVYALITELHVDCAPEYDIRAGDILTVTTETGDVVVLNAARPMKYVTHQELNVRKDGDEA